MDAAALGLVVVGIGSLLNGQVAPVILGAVGEAGHALQQVGVLLRHAAQHPVDHGDHLGAGDAVVGTVAAVLVALDPAQSRRPQDLIGGPIAVDIAVGLGGFRLAVGEPGAHSRDRAPGGG